MASLEPWPRPVSPKVIKPADDAHLDDLMRRFAEQARVEETKPERAVAATAAVEPLQPRRNADTAFELLERASQAFEILISKYENLEEELHDARAFAEMRASEAAATIEQWRRVASELKDQLDTSDRKSEAFKARCETAEARASEAETRLKAAERNVKQVGERVIQAENLSAKLHDKVVTAFGIGSRMHRVLEAIAPNHKEPSQGVTEI